MPVLETLTVATSSFTVGCGGVSGPISCYSSAIVSHGPYRQTRVRAAKRSKDSTALAHARTVVEAAKRDLGERGPVW